MSDDPKPSPGQDVKKAFGLLYRAARTAAGHLPTRNFEEAVSLGAKEVGRAIENVASTLEKEIFKGGERVAKSVRPSSSPPAAAGAPSEAGADADEPKAPTETPPKTDA